MIAMTRTFLLAAAFIALTLPNRGEGAPPAAAGHHDHGAARGVVSLDVYASGKTLHLLTGEFREGNPRATLVHRRSEDGGGTWSEPVPVDAGLPAAHSPHRGNDPQIAAAGDTLVAVWMSKGTGLFDSGPMATALSRDGGQSWRPGPNPADDGSTGGHGFIDIAADAAGAFHLTWLDSRDGKQGLRSAHSADGGKSWSPNQTVKAATCECCSNAIAAGPDGAVGILFRDGSPRDMHLALSKDGGSRWLAPVRVGAFDWEFNGCPHVGGGLTFSQSAVHAVVWSGMPQRNGVHFLTSPDRGGTWSAPLRMGTPAASHPDIAADAGQHVAVVWDDRAVIWCAQSKDGGTSWSEPAPLSKSGATATHPRIVRTSAGFQSFWTETPADGPGTWRGAPIP